MMMMMMHFVLTLALAADGSGCNKTSSFVRVVGFGNDCVLVRSHESSLILDPHTGNYVDHLCLTGPTSVLVTVYQDSGRTDRVSIVLTRPVESLQLPEQRRYRPLASVAQLLRFARSTASLRKRNTSLPVGLLVCHDVRTNYDAGDSSLDPFWSPLAMSQYYTLLHWNRVAVFVFFSHRMFSPPPPGWVVAARRNHCRAVLGTVMIENEADGRSLFMHAKEAAVQLGSLAVDGGFDGWLVNIETQITDAHLLRNVTVFLKTLRLFGFVVLYDCFTIDGKHDCQNTVNNLNAGWLDIVDAFYLNYHWTLDGLPWNNSRVFVGVDVFGRGSYGGAGAHSATLALQAARMHNLSGALFAPAWTLEMHGFDQMDEMLWYGCHWETRTLRLRSTFAANETWRSGEMTLALTTPSISRIVVEIAVPVCLVHPCPDSVHASISCLNQSQSISVQCGRVKKFAIASFTVPFDRPVIVKVSDHYHACHMIDGPVIVRYTSTAVPCAGGVRDVFRSRRSVDGAFVAAPTFSHFSVGKGDAFYVGGRIWRQEGWIDRALTSCLPDLFIDEDHLMQLDFERVFNFGSSLHLVCINTGNNVPLFQLQHSEAPRKIRIVVDGAATLYLEDRALELVETHYFMNNWTMLTFACNGDQGGVLFLKPEHGVQVWLGYFAVHDNEQPCWVYEPTKVIKLENGFLIAWNLFNGPFLPSAYLDIVVDDVLVSRQMGDCSTGSSFQHLVNAFVVELRFHSE